MIRILDKILPEIFITLVLVMVAFGLVMTYSSSVFYAQDVFNNPLHFFYREIIWIVMGLCGAFVLRLVHYQTIQKYSLVILIAATCLLVFTFVPGIGHRVNNANRWIRLAGFTFQPSEMVKYAIIIFIADRLAKNQRHVTHVLRGIIVPLGIIAVPLALILIEPDLGAPVVILATVCILFYVGGTRVWHLIGLGTFALPFLIYFIIRFPYRMQRLMTFLHPDDDPLGAGFQIRQSLMAISSGRMNGVGLGKSVQKMYYLPEAHTDFVFAIIGEEHGFAGTMFVILLFTLFLYVVYTLSKHVKDTFGHLVVIGFMTLIGIQAFVNIGVVTGCLPTKGLALPFISYGGSSLVMTLAACGYIVNIVQSQSQLKYHQSTVRISDMTIV